MDRTQRDHMPELLAQLGRARGAAARRLLEDAVAAHPGDPRPLTLLAAEYVHAGEIDRAEAAYIAALQRAPDLAIARFQLGLLQLTSARPAAAQATWAPLGALPEADPLRLFRDGLEMLAQDRFDEATRLLMQGMARNDTNPALNRDIQMVLDRVAQLAGPGGGEGPAPGQAPGGHFLVSSYRKPN